MHVVADHHQNAATYALLFGHGNAYYVGHYDSHAKEFAPLGVPTTAAGMPHADSRRRLSSTARAVVGAWPLLNNSGASTVGPSAELRDTLPTGGAGTLFPEAAQLTIPFFEALEQPQGITISFSIQLNKPPTNAPRSTILGRSDDTWGIEWWGGSVLNFWVRGGKAGAFRGIQAQLPAQAASGWVRVAMSYDAHAEYDRSIRMSADGESLKEIGDGRKEPGSLSGPIAKSNAGLRSTGLDAFDIADIKIFGGAMTKDELATLTAAAVPSPAPQPAKRPPAPKPKPVGPRAGGPPPGWPMNNMSDTPSYYSFNPHATVRPKPAARFLFCRADSLRLLRCLKSGRLESIS